MRQNITLNQPCLIWSYSTLVMQSMRSAVRHQGSVQYCALVRPGSSVQGHSMRGAWRAEGCYGSWHNRGMVRSGNVLVQTRCLHRGVTWRLAVPRKGVAIRRHWARRLPSRRSDRGKDFCLCNMLFSVSICYAWRFIRMFKSKAKVYLTNIFIV